jgi:uncharacterized protein
MFFVMKISKLCNLRCTYCYEYDELGMRDRMSLAGLDRFFSGIADYYQDKAWRQQLVFVLHGGEPLLLPDTYLQDFCSALSRNLGERGIPYRVSLQTNLTRIDERRIAFLEQLGVSLGVSLDVFGDERVNKGGRDSQPGVLDNLQLLLDTGAVERLRVGAISVLHHGNVSQAVNSFHFYRELGVSYRILPVFSLGDPPVRMRHLTLRPQEVLQALQLVANEQFETPSGIVVYPLVNYLDAAVAELAGLETATYDPARAEWALIVNTNGDVYNHADSYTAEGLMGNIFRDDFTHILDGPARQRTVELRKARGALCDACPHGNFCSRLPVVEALPSERFMDKQGHLHCAIARPMIDFMIERIRSSPGAASLLTSAGQTAAPSFVGS